jgi:quinoprotein glucose dehydrogenase
MRGAPPIDFSGPVSEWPDYGGTRRGERYSPLTQITPANVEHLEVAWVYYTGDVSDGKGDVRSTTAFEATPIPWGGTLYLCGPFNRVIALDLHVEFVERGTVDPTRGVGSALRTEATIVHA